MKKEFLIKIILFIFISAGLVYALNIIYYKFVLVDTILDRSEKQFEKYKDDTRVLLMGDSHVLLGLNPEIIEHSFNYASGAESHIQTYYKLKAILDEGYRPEAILLPMDLHSFSSFRADVFANEWYWNKYGDADYFKLAWETKNFSLLKNEINGLIMFKGRGEELVSALARKIIYKNKNLQLSKVFKGFTPSDGDFSKESDKRGIAKRRVDSHLKDCDYFDGRLSEYFAKILDLAEKNNIAVILVKYPITEEYYEIAKQYITDEAGYYKKITDIAGKYNNIHYLDYQHYFNEKRDFFQDSDHLNNKGADALSDKIKNDIVKILK